MSTLHCRICGEEKPREAFSSAYKNTCKDCRNKQVRQERAIAKEVLEKKESIMFPKVDWGQRLFEASVAIHAARCAAYDGQGNNKFPYASRSVDLAKDLIEELMKVMP